MPTRGSYQAHGTIVRTSLTCGSSGGAPPGTIDAATWVSQRYPGLVEGGPPNFLILDGSEDDPTILKNPRARDCRRNVCVGSVKSA